MIDRNERARLGARLRADSRLTHSAYRAAQAVLFGAMNGLSGHCQAFRQWIADQAAVSLSSVDRAIGALEEFGYLTKVPTYGKHRERDGRWFRPRGASVFIWRAELFLNVRKTTDSSPKVIPRSNQKLSTAVADEMARAEAALMLTLARFGNTVADRAGLPGGAVTA